MKHSGWIYGIKRKSQMLRMVSVEIAALLAIISRHFKFHHAKRKTRFRIEYNLIRVLYI